MWLVKGGGLWSTKATRKTGDDRTRTCIDETKIGRHHITSLYLTSLTIYVIDIDDDHPISQSESVK